MRVAIYHNLPDGGAIRALFELVQHSYREVDYDLYQLAPVDSGSRYDFKQYVGTLHSANFVYQPSKADLLMEIGTRFGKLRSLQKDIAAQIDAGGYDAVFVHHCGISQTPFLLEYLQTPALYYIQEPRRLSFEPEFYDASRDMIAPWLRPLWGIRQNIIKQLDTENARQAQAVLCNSKFEQKAIRAAYDLSAEVCYLGIDAQIFTYRKETKQPEALLVGTIHPAKGQQRALESVALYNAKQSRKDQLGLTLVYENADPRFVEQLQGLADQKKVRLTLRQGVSDEQLATLYRQSQVTLCVADKEPFGFTPLESTACGTPAVAVKEGGYQETVNQGNGILVAKNPQAIAQGIEAVRSNQWRAADMSRRVRSQWSWEASAQTYLKALRGLIDG